MTQTRNPCPKKLHGTAAISNPVAGRLSGSSGRKSVVWVSQAYGAELDLSAISGATDSSFTSINSEKQMAISHGEKHGPYEIVAPDSG